MKAVCRAEAKSNCALFGVIGLPCRDIETLAEQGLLVPGALVLHAQDVFHTPQATSVLSALAGSNQPVMPSGKASKSSGRWMGQRIAS